MAQIINMPKEGITVESCLVGAWRKEVGDPVAEGDVLFDYETDKAAFECLSNTAGVLLHKFYAEGDEAAVLTPVAIVGEAGEDVSPLIAEVGAAAPAETAETKAAADAAQDDDDDVNDDDDDDDDVNDDDDDDGDDSDDDNYEIESDDDRDEISGEAEQTDEAIDTGDTGSIKISPRARSLAEEHGVDISLVSPTGPRGRILEADVIAAINAGAQDAAADEAEDEDEGALAAYTDPEESEESEEFEESEESPADIWGADAQVAEEGAADAGGVEGAADAGGVEGAADAEGAGGAADEAMYADEQFSKIRSVIGKTMVASLQRSAQLTNHHSFDATSILGMREDFKTTPEAAGYTGVSVGDIILYVVSRLLVKHPEINALVADTGIRKYYTVNLGFAVDTPRGLMVPTLFGAEKMSLREISGEVRELASAAREGSISPDKLTGGTFTVSNLGATGVEVFTPIINPPQAAIAGISGIVERVRKGKDGSIEVYPSIGVSLTYDHRAVDGAPASRFAQELCEALAGFSWKTLALEPENE